MPPEADSNQSDASSDVTIRADLSGAGRVDQGSLDKKSAKPVPAIDIGGDGGNTTRTIRADLQQPGGSKEAPSAKSAKAKLGLPPGGIPGYAISRRLGAGGMGQVYEATRESDGCAVALKLLRADAIADPEFRERFQREAEVMKQVSHANVVGYMGAGEHEGWLYLATELMRDGDLDRYLKRRGQLFEKDALTLVLKTAEGIAAIHAAGLIHRDIKPQNIFLDHRASETGDVKVGDLGMARHESGEDRMTMTGTACGTPAYMSPEQLRGEADVDHRADTYALGVMLYTLLAGREPFVGDTAFTVSHAVLREQAPDLRRFCQVSSTTAAIVRQAMRKERADRYQTVNDLIDDCRRAIAGERPLHAGLIEPAAPVAITTSSASPLSGGGGGGLGGRIGDIAANIAGAGPVVKVVFIGIVIVAGLSMLPGILERKTRTTASGSATLVEAKPIRDEAGTGILLTVNGVRLPLRWCPPGSFTMGSPDDESGRVFWETAHTVTLGQGIWVLANEVTNAQWAAVMGGNTHNAGEFPRVNVSRAQVETFCERLSSRLGVVARLPSDAEWERACRAGTSAPFAVNPNSEALATDPAILASWKTQPTDSHPNEQTLIDALNDAQRRGLGPRQTASGLPNPWGIYDCHGNVQEWCLDRWNHRDAWSSDSQTNPVDTNGPLTVVRGGSWMHPAERARSSARDAMDGDVGWEWIGFRFVIEGGPIPQPLPSE